MSHPLESILVQVLDPRGVTVGAGFFLAPDLAVTCAHVVKRAKSAVGQPVEIELFANRQRVTAQVLFEGWSPSDQDDVAFLRVPVVPPMAQPLTLGFSAGRLGHDYAALGFPDDRNYLAYWVLGKLTEPVPAAGTRRPVLQFQGGEIEKGMSGAPVLDLRSNQIVGMVCEFKDRSRSRTAYGVTVETLRQNSPDPLQVEDIAEMTGGEVYATFKIILAALKQAGIEIRVRTNPASGEALFDLATPDFGVLLTRQTAEYMLGEAQRSADSLHREQVYLARFILDHNYSRWEREYLPLSGRLMEPGPLTTLRLRDSQDPSLSQAGEKLDDLRDAITKYGRTRFVILGEPGCGKTTTLERLALDVAHQRLNNPHSAKIPLRVDLDFFNKTPIDPDKFLREEWQKTGLLVSYDDCVLAGEVCFLLDGVNQMPFDDRPDRIERWRRWVHDLKAGNWAVFTCRSSDYQPRLSIPEVHVQQLDANQIQRYLEIRLGDDPSRRKRVTDELERCFRSGDHRLLDLARNIFMLTLLVERAIEDKKLSGNRAVLMEDLVLRRLDREFQCMRQPPKVRLKPQEAARDVQSFLRRLAYQMQKQSGATAMSKAELSRYVSIRGEALLLEDEEALKLGLDSGLLEEKTDSKGNISYAFYHHLLHEYFAGQELLEHFRAGADLSVYWRVNWQKPDPIEPLPAGEQLPPPPVTGWEETTRMAAAQSGKDLHRFVQAVAEHNLPLAGRCLAEAEEQSELTEQFRKKLLQRQRSPRAHLRGRIDAGLALGELGHPDLRRQPFSFEGRTVWAILPPMQAVAAGPFIFGSSREDPQAFPDEYTDPRQIDLPAFEIGRYPVTNAEFYWFIEAGGYDQPRWWDEEGWIWRQGGPQAHAAAIEQLMKFRSWLQQQDLDQIAGYYNWTKLYKDYWADMIRLDNQAARQRAEQAFSRPFDRPAFWDDAGLSAWARPVVGVNWYEARAYCRWLSALSRRTYELPPEKCWEKAARGVDGRTYPWKGGFDKNRCNTVESQIYTTTPVGLYAEGSSPFGLFDVAGNVWEWCADFYRPYPGGDPEAIPEEVRNLRVVRGGSWSVHQRNARCAFRYWDEPVYFDNDFGFRLFSPG
ncbi:MAG TPA: hypothetical protein DCE76_10165 [Anaerolineaceae bacterium]|nr:hypothetical protein [Anaerolineaceae bacterium]